jgi:zinc transporter ZupT
MDLSDELALAKVGIGFVLLVVALVAVFGVLSVYRIIMSRFHSVFHFMLDASSCFAGGIFLAAGMIHLLPDALESFPGEDEFPFAFVTCVLTVFLLLLIEKIVLPGAILALEGVGFLSYFQFFLFRQDKHVDEETCPVRPIRAEVENYTEDGGKADARSDSDLKHPGDCDTGSQFSGCCYGSSDSASDTPLQSLYVRIAALGIFRLQANRAADALPHKEGDGNAAVASEEHRTTSEHNHNGHAHDGEHTVTMDAHPHGPHSHQPSKLVSVENSLLSIVLVAALSSHSFFEGLAIGLAVDLQFATVAFAAVVAHKGFAVGAVAMELYQSDLRTLISIFGGVLISLMSPLGILIGGIIVFVGSDSNAEVEAVFNAVAAGSFLYIGMIELGHHMEYSAGHRGLFAVLMLWSLAMVGFCGMGVLALWA